MERWLISDLGSTPAYDASLVMFQAAGLGQGGHCTGRWGRVAAVPACPLLPHCQASPSLQPTVHLQEKEQQWLENLRKEEEEEVLRGQKMEKDKVPQLEEVKRGHLEEMKRSASAPVLALPAPWPSGRPWGVGVPE